MVSRLLTAQISGPPQVGPLDRDVRLGYQPPQADSSKGASPGDPANH